MAKFKDKEKAGRSKVIPFDPSEDHRDRHVRRKEANLQMQDHLEKWCDANGLRMVVTNEGHHWSFYAHDAKRGDPQLFEWWPASAKMVIAQQYRKGIHVHDITQVIKIAESRLRDRLTALKKN
jgi:hypothetical protein